VNDQSASERKPPANSDKAATDGRRDRDPNVRGDAGTGRSEAENGKSSQTADEGGGAEEDSPGFPRMAIAAAFVVVAALLVWGGYTHWRTNSQAEKTQADATDTIPTVRVATAKREDSAIETILPGQTEAFQTANLYARATGYIAERKVDIGSRVKKGDLLVRIAAPDLDQQLAQAEAQLGQAKASVVQANAQVTQADANLKLQSTNLERTTTLTRQGFETAQNEQTQQTTVHSQQASLETANAGVAVAEANLRAQQATVDRLRALAAFEKVVAPFDGVVTARNVEVGDLVNANSGSGAAMFTVDQDDVLRVALQVPQYSSQGVHDGLEAKITLPETPGRAFFGKVARSSVALLYSTRTLTAEVDVPNPDGALRPGLYVNVALRIPRAEAKISVPSDALIFDQHGMQVAVVESNDTIKMLKVEVDRDLGTQVELKDGLKGGENVVIGAPIDLKDGSKVKLAPNNGAAPDTSTNVSKAQSGTTAE
jgi:HlyD family secretion protein